MVTSLLLLALAAPPIEWSDGVAWKGYDEALQLAKKEKKPICLVFFAEWCPHCRNYARVFRDPAVIEKSKKLVMVRLDADKNAELSAKYALDGAYVPRTYFLQASGEVATDIRAPRDDFKYFYDESDPRSLLAAMDAALKKPRK